MSPLLDCCSKRICLTSSTEMGQKSDSINPLKNQQLLLDSGLLPRCLLLYLTIPPIWPCNWCFLCCRIPFIRNQYKDILAYSNSNSPSSRKKTEVNSVLINGVRTCFSNSAMAEVFQTMHPAALISIKIHRRPGNLKLLFLNWEETI